MQTDNDKKIVSMLGLARRAGCTVLGVPLLIEALRHPKGKPVKLAYVASDASNGTKKKVRFKCEYYGVPLYTINISTTDLGHALGKSSEIAALGVCNESFAKYLERLSSENEAEAPQISTGKDSFASAKDVNL